MNTTAADDQTTQETGFGATLRSLRIRNFRLFFVGQMLSGVGNWLRLIAQSLLVLHITDNNGVAVGVLTACQFLPVLFLAPWAGLVTDRNDTRLVLIGAQIGSMFQSLALGVLALFDQPPLIGLYVVATVGGVFTAFDNPARRTLVVEMVPETHVQNAVGLNSALIALSRVIGPALAGVLIVTVGYAWCFFLDAFSFAFVLTALFRIDVSALRRVPPTPAAKGQIREGLRYVRGENDLFVPLVVMGIVGTFALNFAVVIPLFVKKSLGGSDTAFTVTYSIVAVGSLIAALVAARRTMVSTRDVVRGSTLFGVALCALACAPSLLVAAPLSVFLGFASIVFMTSTTATVQIKTAPEMRGRVLALQAMVFFGSTPIGGPLVGAVCDWLGPRAGLVLGGVACFGAAAWGTAASRTGRPSERGAIIA